MPNIRITPNVRTEVSPLLKKFLETRSELPQIKNSIDKYDYVGVNSFNTNIEKEASRHTYFCPDAVIDPKDSEVAKRIHVIA